VVLRAGVVPTLNRPLLLAAAEHFYPPVPLRPSSDEQRDDYQRAVEQRDRQIAKLHERVEQLCRP
jgi:hypothetical protein